LPVVCAVCDKLSNELLLGADIDKLNRVWLTDQYASMSDIDMTVVSDENSCVTTKTMNTDMNDDDDDDDDDDDNDNETAVDLDEVNKDEVSAKSRNVADAEQIALEQQNGKSLVFFCFFWLIVIKPDIILEMASCTRKKRFWGMGLNNCVCQGHAGHKLLD